jgi:3-dehydroquinate dehydratase-2
MSADKHQIGSVLVLQGPNLNLLGTREPEIYGKETLDDIHQQLLSQAVAAQVHLVTYQSNHEGEMIDRIQAAKLEGVQFIILNPGGYSHTSVAIRDALVGVGIPFIEVHLSNIHQREAFRHHSYFSDVAIGVICGLGSIGYRLALEAVITKLKKIK